MLRQGAGVSGGSVVNVSDPKLGERWLYCQGDVSLLFTENETNTERIFGVPNRNPYVKDSINNYIVHGQKEAVNPQKDGTKVAAHYRLNIAPSESQTVYLRLSDAAPGQSGGGKGNTAGPFDQFEAKLQARKKEADEFYANHHSLLHSMPTPLMSCVRHWRE